eukprot:TRINITY_DN958_c0_g1_i1.p2 TRINITY_DN958_c0_g1~~TRINITY_DN958_c0_g1_i1.p2  ORF type:complete len:102 (-),score=0.56 TRINITY_DN958_c0_g1_i1:1035-1340(-)
MCIDVLNGRLGNGPVVSCTVHTAALPNLQLGEEDRPAGTVGTGKPQAGWPAETETASRAPKVVARAWPCRRKIFAKCSGGLPTLLFRWRGARMGGIIIWFG